MAQAQTLTREEPKPDQVGNTFMPSLKVHRLERRMTLAITLLPFLGLAIGLPVLWGRGVGKLDAALLVGFYLVTGLGVTAGFHRMFTHRSFDGPEWLRVAFAVAGSMAIQGPVIRWVADHRRHHAFTDKPGDPHSPHLEEAEGWRGVLRGLWHSHIGWFFDREATNIPRYAPDLLKEKPMVWVDRTFPLWVVVSFLAPAAIGALVTGTLAGAASAFIWGGLLRIFLLHHVTWSINSICHFYGKRPFDSGDLSTNNWLMALVAFGEGWHNNHHAFPSSARQGLEWWQIDPAGYLIAVLAKLGLARDVKIPSSKQMAAKRV